jgi:hypothetical protein
MKKVFILVVLSVLVAASSAQRKFNNLADAQRALQAKIDAERNNKRNVPKTTTNENFETVLENGAVRRTSISKSSNKAAGGNSESHEVKETTTFENSTDIVIETRRKSYSRSGSFEIQAVLVEETASASSSKEKGKGGRGGGRRGGRRGGCRRRKRRRGCRRGLRRHRIGRALRIVYYRIWIGDNVTKSYSLEVHTYAINFIGVMKLASARFGGPWTFKYIGFPCGKRITQLGKFPNDPATNKVWVLYDLKRRPNQKKPPKDAFIVSRSPSHYKIKEFHTYLFWYRTYNNVSIYPIYTEDSTAVLPTIVKPKWTGPAVPPRPERPTNANGD